jgi:hypothetical protein
MKEFFSGMIVAFSVYIVILLIWYIQLGAVVADCKRYGLFTAPGAVYECREMKP